MRALILAAAVFPALAAAGDALVADLEQRLAGGGADQVNAYLDGRWASAMVPFNQKTTNCELQAVSLAVRLSRSAHARAAQAHDDALRGAVGGCPALVLALASRQEVPKFCSAIASWGASQTARELRRRIAAIESDEALRTSPNGQACHAACLYELHNTRVGLRSKPPGSPRQH